jgi:hypothetical protein
MKKLLFFILVFFVHFTAQAADGFSTLEERMSGQEFKQTGLVKLTDEELLALNEWIRRHSVATLENASAPQTVVQVDGGMIPLTTSDTRGLGYLGVKSTHDREDVVINGMINGLIDGWGGKGTLFKLTNGMIWEQTERDTYSIDPVGNAKVTITKNSLGNWHLSLVGHDRSVRVKRIR